MSSELKVLTIVLIVWVGIFIYLMNLDREVRKLRDRDR